MTPIQIFQLFFTLLAISVTVVFSVCFIIHLYYKAKKNKKLKKLNSENLYHDVQKLKENVLEIQNKQSQMNYQLERYRAFMESVNLHNIVEELKTYKK